MCRGPKGVWAKISEPDEGSSPISEAGFRSYLYQQRRDAATSAGDSDKVSPCLEDDIEAASEVASVGSKELAELRIRNIVSHITRIEVICKVKGTN